MILIRRNFVDWLRVSKLFHHRELRRYKLEYYRGNSVGPLKLLVVDQKASKNQASLRGEGRKTYEKQSKHQQIQLKKVQPNIEEEFWRRSMEYAVRHKCIFNINESRERCEFLYDFDV